MHSKTHLIRSLFLVLVLAAISGPPALVLCFSASVQAAEQGPVQGNVTMKKTLTILALGDSLTAGYGLLAEQAWPALVQARLQAEGLDVHIINAGVSGDTTGGGLARLDWALEERPDAAVVALGANDMLRGLSPANMYNNLDTLLATLQQHSLPVLILGMQAAQQMGVQYVRQYNAVFPELAQKYTARLYPFMLEGVAGRPALNQADGIHPNVHGTKIIADSIYPLVRALVEDVRQSRQVTN